MYRLVCLLILVSGAFGEVILQGSCNYAAIGGYVTDLNATRMIGTWNQIARLDSDGEMGECTKLNLSGIYDATGELMALQATWTNVLNKNKTSYDGIITPMEIDGMFYMNFTDGIVANFVVQSTNYTDYAVLYACLQLSPGNATQNATKAVAAWQYHRKAELSSSELAAVQELANVNPDLRDNTWKHVSHNKTACGNGAVTLAVPYIVVVLATVFISKEFV